MNYKIYVKSSIMAQFMQVLGFNQIKDIQLGENSDNLIYDGNELIEVSLKKDESKNLIKRIFGNSDKDEYTLDNNLYNFESIYKSMFSIE